MLSRWFRKGVSAWALLAACVVVWPSAGLTAARGEEGERLTVRITVSREGALGIRLTEHISGALYGGRRGLSDYIKWGDGTHFGGVIGGGGCAPPHGKAPEPLGVHATFWQRHRYQKAGSYKVHISIFGNSVGCPGGLVVTRTESLKLRG